MSNDYWRAALPANSRTVAECAEKRNNSGRFRISIVFCRIFTLSLNSFNVLNHPNYVSYIGTESSPLFGKPVAAQPPRRMQLDVQFKF